MPEVLPLKPVGLREVWPHEAHHFTPWLAENIERLGAELDLRFEQVATEVTLPGAGRVDIHAEQVGTGARVVIENQLEDSDDGHCLGLLGYAARAEASILVWVARSFSSYHRSILEWLNDADTIHVYAVAVRAYRVGDALAADFETVVAPRESQPTASSPAKSTTNFNTLSADFYRPLTERLRRRGIHPVGRGGWRGRWRSFQAGHDGAVYGTGLDDGTVMVFLCLRGTARQERFRALREHQEDIAGKVEASPLWEESSHESSVTLKRAEDFDLTGPEEDLETARRWMADNLVRLRNAVQPHLDRLIGADEDDAGEGIAAG